MENDFIICQSEIALRVKDIIAIIPKKETLTEGEEDKNLWELYASMSNGHVLLMSKHIPGSDLQNVIIRSAYTVKKTYDSCLDEEIDYEKENMSNEEDELDSETPFFNPEFSSKRSAVLADSE